MKKCPYCKADIEDSARFCLYCMKPLNEKKNIPPQQKKQPWWILVVAGVLLVTLVAVFLLSGRKDPVLSAESTGGETVSMVDTTAQTTEETTTPTQEETVLLPEQTQSQQEPQPSDEPEPSKRPEQPQNSEPTESAEGTKPTKPPSVTQPTTPPPTTVPKDPTPTTPKETEPETTAETTQPEAPKSEAVYTYRAARAGDDFSAQYTNNGNDIVITGIAQQSADGVYDIPAYMDGKKVIAIVANAFYGSNAKMVYVPASVKNIWNYAFNGCSLTDIYFRGSAIYVESRAFSSALTIHCSASCSDRNFRYFKNSAANYGATWTEWNG